MSRLLVSIRSLTVIFAVLILSARFIGNLPPSAAPMFDSGACKGSCWHGIRVGQTTFEQARTLLLADPQLVITNQLAAVSGACTIGWTAPDYWLGCINAADLNVNSVVRSISIYPGHSFRLGDAVALFGPPLFVITCTFSDPTAAIMYHGMVYLYFAADIEISIVQVQKEPLRLDPDMLVGGIRFYDPADKPPYRSNAIRWSGFTTYQPSCSN